MATAIYYPIAINASDVGFRQTYYCPAFRYDFLLLLVGQQILMMTTVATPGQMPALVYIYIPKNILYIIFACRIYASKLYISFSVFRFR